MSNQYPDFKFWFKFVAPNGDEYAGIGFADSHTVAKDQAWYSPYGSHLGYYLITGEQEYGYDLSPHYGANFNEGVTYVTSYLDVATGISYVPYHYSQNNPSSYKGLGSEYDYVWKDYWDDFGYGGYYLA